ncbi:MAG: hypothetical protein ACRCYO_09905 [Bacteroidia bacterium]
MHILNLQFRHIALCLFILLIAERGLAQTHAQDQRLITLTNGYQFLGYIVEQRPGIDLKLYRPTESDTVTILMKDVRKVTRVSVNSYSKRSGANDSVYERGRFNNKKNVYQFSYIVGGIMQRTGMDQGTLTGFSLAYYRNLHNRFYIGGSVNYIRDDFFYDWKSYEMKCFSVLAEGKMRFSRKPQNKRLSTLLGVQMGFMQCKGFGWDEYHSYLKHIVTGNNRFAFGTSLSFKVNPDSNSGFCFEPSILFFRPEISSYQYGYNDNITSQAFTRPWVQQLTLRCSYYF